MGEPDVGGESTVRLTEGEVTGTLVSMGNPHFVVFVSEFETDWQAIAGQISKHHGFHAWHER